MAFRACKKHGNRQQTIKALNILPDYVCRYAQGEMTDRTRFVNREASTETTIT